MMTTILLSYFIRYQLRWPVIAVVGILLLFGVVELSFFITNVAKIKERWMFLFFELFIFMVMFVWYYARKINNRFVHFVELGKYTGRLRELSEDHEIPRFATHVIYLTKANNREHIEEKIINSIFSKRPKRADVYWFLHINYTDEPYTLRYEVTELLDDKVIKINLDMGFRIQPRTELFFKKIVRELVQQHELNLHIRPDGSTRYNPEPDFRFVLISKFLSVENEFTIREGLLLNAYFQLKKWAQSDEQAFGLDKSDVEVESVPLIYHQAESVELVRTK
jgi:KUP system potassium uptake protein